MKPLDMCPPMDRGRCMGITVHGMSGDQHFAIDFIDEGGGFFVTLKDCDELRLDPDELIRLAEWVKSVCTALDQQATHLGERT